MTTLPQPGTSSYRGPKVAMVVVCYYTAPTPSSPVHQSILRRCTTCATPYVSDAETCSLQCAINIPAGSCAAQRSLLMSQYVDVTVHNTIATVTLNNPAKRGALSLAAMQQLPCAFQDMRARQNIHVVVL